MPRPPSDQIVQQLAAQLRDHQAEAAIAANLKELGHDG
jgi:hypothetical protein